MSEYVRDDRGQSTFRVNRKAMTDPAIFAAERARIFDQTWLYVGHESEVPNPHDFRTRSVGSRPIILLRDAGGGVRVFINSCPHRGSLLCTTTAGRAETISCANHGWTFNSSGALVDCPDDDAYGAGFDWSRFALAEPARVDSYRGFVFVSFTPSVVDLTEHLAGTREYIDLISDQSAEGMTVLSGSHEYSMRANWKLLVENSVDGYHAMSVHQRYVEMLIAAGKKPDPTSVKRGYDLGNGHAVTAGPAAELFRPLPTESARQKYEARKQALRGRFDDEWVERMYGSRNMIIFPNLVLIDHVIGIVIRKIDPIAPDYTEITSWELAPPGEDDELRQIRLDGYVSFWGPGGLATPDDVEALESCQLGYAGAGELAWSDISRGLGRPDPRSTDELQMRAFWRRWNELITGEVLPPEGPVHRGAEALSPGWRAVTGPAGLPPELIARLAVEDFLYAEADLLDRWELMAWLELFGPDSLYLVPTTDLPGGTRDRDLLLIQDDHFMLSQRVKSLLTRSAHAEYPHSRTRRLVTNVRVQLIDEETVSASANFSITRTRRTATEVYQGRYEHILLRHPDTGFQFATRRSVLDLESLRPHGKLSIIL